MGAPKDLVVVAARDVKGRYVSRMRMSRYQWYEELHPIIDEGPGAVASLGVRRVDGAMYDDDGDEVQRWLVLYNDRGLVVCQLTTGAEDRFSGQLDDEES